MTDAPETIWAMAPHIGEYLADPPVSPIDLLYLTEYRRVDIPPKVRALEWKAERTTGGYVAKTILGSYRVIECHNDWMLCGAATKRGTDPDALKAAAQADFAARILSSLEV